MAYSVTYYEIFNKEEILVNVLPAPYFLATAPTVANGAPVGQIAVTQDTLEPWILVNNIGVNDWRRIHTGVTQTASANLVTNQVNVTGEGTPAIVIFDQVFYDTTGGYDPLTGIFTAIDSGVYLFNTTVTLIGIDNTMVWGRVFFNVSGTGPDALQEEWLGIQCNPWLYQNESVPMRSNLQPRWNISSSFTLNAGDQVSVGVEVRGGTKTVSISRGMASAPNRPTTTWLKITKL